MKEALKYLPEIKDGRSLQTNYGEAPDLRKLFKRSHNHMDVWARNRGGPVKMEIYIKKSV